MISAYVKRKLAKGVLFGTLAVVVALLASCNSDDLSGDSYYTFKGETVATYIENRPDSVAIFTKIVEDAGEYSLLSTYGHYTAFVPTDVAFDTYFKAHHTSLDALTKED